MLDAQPLFPSVPIRVPLENTNDESVKLLLWLVEDGAAVGEGQSIAEVETSKAVVELIAPVSGKIALCARPGDEVAVGAVVAHVGSEESLPNQTEVDSASAEGLAQVAPSGPEDSADPGPPGTRFSKKALELIERHGLSSSAFTKRAMVREHDVLEFLSGMRPAEADRADLHFALREISLTGVTLPANSKSTEGKIDPEFLDHLRKNAEAFSNLSSAEKCKEYQNHGAVIGSDVVIGNGTVILTPQLVLGDSVQIGEHSHIDCWERFVAGQLTSFRAGLSVHGGTVVVGENVFAGFRIEIAGGGKADPWSLLCVGDTTFIGDDVRINIHRPVLIGKEVFLTERTMLITHNIGHSILEGYENRFEPVVLEDYSQVGMNSTVYAGTRIGYSAIVGSNSYVISSIPNGKLAIGVPARVVRDAARPPDRKRQVQIAQKMVRDYHELLRLKGFDVSPVASDSFTLSHDGKRFQLAFTESYPAYGFHAELTDGSVIWALETSASPPPGCTLMNLLAKTIEGGIGGIFADSAREFLRKRGIRCQPGPWRYRQGFI